MSARPQSLRLARRVFRKTLCLLAAWLLPAATGLQAATYHVRPDGGTAAQCSGLSDAPYPGSGLQQNCAWVHPFIALPPSFSWNTRAARIHGGDTLLIGHGSYMMGVGAPGADACAPDTAYDCRAQAVPGGPDASHPTRILGEGYAAGCTEPPELWGTERAYALLNVAGVQGGAPAAHVEVGCLELTDHDSCIYQHCDLGGCQPDQVDACNASGSPPWGPWARNGITLSDVKDLSLHDLNIHGLASEGIRGGRLTDIRVERVRLWANGFAGWDNDISYGIDDTSNHGTLLFRHLEVAYSGCGERYPSGEIFGCWDQTSGGYGDGLGAGHTAGNWVIEDSFIHDNVSDGLDLLYADGAPDTQVVYRRVHAERNAGNQMKAAGNVLIEDSVGVGTCAEPWASFPPNNYPGPVDDPDFRGRYNMHLAGACRANGDTVSLKPYPGNQVVLRDNTLTGQGGCQVVWTVSDANRHDTSAHLVLANNALIGGNMDWLYLATGGGHRLTCGTYAYNTDVAATLDDNYLWNIRDTDVAHCPAGNLCGRSADQTSPSTYCGASPCVAGGPAPGMIDSALLSFNPDLLPNSPLIDAALKPWATSFDFLGLPRPYGRGYDIGAIEYRPGTVFAGSPAIALP